MYLTVVVDYEYAVETDADGAIGDRVGVSVAETRIKGVEFIWENVSDVLQGSYLEHLRLSMDHFSFKGAEKPIRTQYNRAIRHHETRILSDPLYIISCIISLSNGSRC